MKRPTKLLIRARANFRERVISLLKALGGIEDNRFYQFTLNTPIGEMGLSVWDTAIMCRFEDVEKATEFTNRHTSQGCNPFSGKWNWHFDDDAKVLNGQPESQFVRYMAKLMSAESWPKDLTQLTTEQTEQAVEQLSKLPLRDLRRRQELTKKQMALAFEMRHDESLRNFQVRFEHLRMAVDRQCFGYIVLRWKLSVSVIESN